MDESYFTGVDLSNLVSSRNFSRKSRRKFAQASRKPEKLRLADYLSYYNSQAGELAYTHCVVTHRRKTIRTPIQRLLI